jgi:hypothetical protein
MIDGIPAPAEVSAPLPDAVAGAYLRPVAEIDFADYDYRDHDPIRCRST